MSSALRYQGIKNIEESHHLSCAKQLFNRVWDLMLKENRTEAEVDEMIHAAHASRYHWGVVGTELNAARGDWQLSRAYAVIGNGESALYYAKRCFELCLTYALGAFDTGYAH
ncbi:hypothetical protein [Paenibacillus sp. 1001270B_150601_E10]|uniref:hypothetical protein n=1 Tax=Paenibacillus sp. 1001270B_150601_E10 TaxID=2787079 RepID=UPI00189EBE99|nr:hypothetical protein [Paenibacillus sp. 1001270B_150601_E10]